MSLIIIGIAVLALLVGISIFLAMLFRTVCAPDEVHIVQVGSKSKVYGAGQDLGNVYYHFPSWIPFVGVVVRELPVSNFSIAIDGYEAYDIGKVPFAVDVISFFRVDDATTASKRIENFGELKKQLQDILKGAIRTILAGTDIEDIMTNRATFGEKFSEEVDVQLKEWGVVAVKNIELMDIRDSGDTEVVTNIMQKKRSLIDKESRVEVAKNQKDAKLAEIEADREMRVKNEKAEAMIGQEQANKEKVIGIAREKAKQDIATQGKITTEKDMAVLQVQEVKTAEINKSVQIVKAEEEKAKMKIEAEGKQVATVTIAGGDKDAKLLEAEGIYAVGSKEAEVVAEKERAAVAGEIELADKIAKQPQYMKYLQDIKGIAAGEEVGKEQAKALSAADLKLISTGGGKNGDINGLLDMLSSQGGANLGAMIDTFKGVSGIEKLPSIKEIVGKDKK